MASVLSQDTPRPVDDSLDIVTDVEERAPSATSVLRGESASDTPLNRIRRKLDQLETSLAENKTASEAIVPKVLPSSPNPPLALGGRAQGNNISPSPSPSDLKIEENDTDRQNHGHQGGQPILPTQERRKPTQSTAPSPPLPQRASTASRTPPRVPSNPCECPCGRVFTRTDHMRRHRSLNICVAGFDHPGVPKRVSAAAKKAAKTASTASSSTPPTSRPSSAVLRESGTFPGSIRRSTTSPAESEPADPSLDALPTSESTENMDDSVLCACGKRFSRKDGRIRHQRMNACKAGPISPNELTAAEQPEPVKDGSTENARLEELAQETQMKKEKDEKRARQAEASVAAAEAAEERAKQEEDALLASRGPADDHPAGATRSSSHVCPCGKVYSRNDSLMRHRASNKCVGGRPRLQHDLSIPGASTDAKDASWLDSGVNLRRSGRVSLKRPIVDLYADEAEVPEMNPNPPPKKRARKNTEPGQLKSGAKHRAPKLLLKAPPALDGDEPESEDETLIGGMSSSTRSSA